MGNFRTIDYSKFKDRLRKYANGKKDKEIAELLHMNTTTFSKKINNTDGQQFSIDDIVLLAAEFNCSVDDLLGINEPDKPISYNTLNDFLSRLLPICENEYHSIIEVDSIKQENGRNAYALVFSNEEICNILSDLQSLEGMNAFSYDGRIYKAWKSDQLQTSKERLKVIEYESTFHHLRQVMSKLRETVEQLKEDNIPFEFLPETDRKLILEYGNFFGNDYLIRLLEEYDELVSTSL